MDEEPRLARPARDERAHAFDCLVAGGALLAATGGTCAWLGAGAGCLIFAAAGLLMIVVGFFRYHDG